MPMAGLRVHGGDDPVLRDPPRDLEHPRLPALALGLIEVLTQHRRQQLGSLRHRRTERAAIEERQAGVPVLGAGVDQLLPTGLVLPVDLRLAQRHVIITAGQHRSKLPLKDLVGEPSAMPGSPTESA